jgi:hypothetical protein
MTTRFVFPNTGIAVSQGTLLAIDDVSLPLRRNLCYYLTKPTVRPEPVLTPEKDRDAPDGCATHFYGGVVHEGDRYRMWYYAVHFGEGRDPHLGNLVEGPTCYAESEDGIHWVKPALHQVAWRGSLENNIIALKHSHSEGVHVIKDVEEPDPTRRYKLIYNYRPENRNFWTIRTATSSDGFRWTDGADLPFDAFIEQSSLFRHNGMYYVHGQVLERSEGGHPAGRQGGAIVSADFDHWLQETGEGFWLPEPHDPAQRGHTKPYDQVHIGVGATSFGNACVGLYCIWHNRPFPTPTDWFGIGTTSGDFGLVVSNDGLHFREPVKGHVWLQGDESPVDLPGVKHTMIMCQGNGILNVGDETRIYHGRWANTADVNDYHAEIALATLPRDRWGALGLFPDQVEGSVWSCPVTLPTGSCRVSLNADRACDMCVEIADERFGLLPAYSGAQSGTSTAEGGLLDCPVTWPQGDLAALGGQTVRFRFQIKRSDAAEPRLYAVYLA